MDKKSQSLWVSLEPYVLILAWYIAATIFLVASMLLIDQSGIIDYINDFFDKVSVFINQLIFK